MAEICPSCMASPGQGHDPDCNADRRPRENGVLVCKCDYSAMLKVKVARLTAEVERLRVLAASSIAMSIRAGEDEPWSLRECVLKLVEAADILLHQKDYDGMHWELIQSAWTHAKEYLAAPEAGPVGPAVDRAGLEADVEMMRQALLTLGVPARNAHAGLSRIAAALGVKEPT
jgi:hypothetical protein